MTDLALLFRFFPFYCYILGAVSDLDVGSDARSVL